VIREAHRSYAAAVRYRVLGAVELEDDEGRPRPIGSPNQRAVLASLVAHRGEVVPSDALVDLLWPDGPPPSATTSLRTYVSRLRRTLGADLVSRGGGYVLDVAAESVDACRFEQLVVRSRQEDPTQRVGTLADALASWGGPAFGAERDVDLVRGEARRLDELHGTARQALAEAQLAAGAADRAVGTAEALLADEPLREGAWITLVGALAVTGRAAEALRAAQRARDALGDAGLEASPSLRRAERDALAPDPGGPDHVEATPPTDPGASAVRRSAIPRRTSSFVGREGDLVEVDELLARRRVVTLVGPGGVGKTRLAMEVARRRSATMRDGSAWVDLATLPTGAPAAGAVVAALGVVEGGDPLATLRDAGHLDALLVLDNAEHVLDPVCEAIEALLADGENVRILVTSRERIGVAGEHVRPVTPLETEGRHAPARRLLLERVEQVGATPPDPSDVRLDALVRRLDGLPLAIEMAAAQLATSSLTEVVAAVAEGVVGLDPLPRGVPERHRTLDAVLSWSEERLDPTDRTLLAELGVLAGPLSARDIAAALARPDAGAGLRRLAAASLVSADTTFEQARYGLLQTVRDRALHRLTSAGLLDEVSQRHARWLATLVDAECRRVCGPDELDARRRIDALLPELRAAVAWAADHDMALAADLVGPLYTYARQGLVDEPFRWADAALARSGDGDPRPPGLVAMAAAAALVRGDLRLALALGEEAAATDDLDARIAALDLSADALLFLGELDDAAAAYASMGETARLAGDSLHVEFGRLGAILTLSYAGRREEARRLAENLIAGSFTNPTARAWAEYGAGEAILDRDPPVALAHLDRAMAIGRSAQSWYVVNMATVSAMSLQARHGELSAAIVSFGEVISRLDRIGDRPHLLTVLRNLIVLLQRLDADEEVAWLTGFVDDPMHPSYGEEAELVRAASDAAWASLGERRWAELTVAGSAMAPREAGGWALAVLARLGR